MNLIYFNTKRELKKIYNVGMKAIQRKDRKYINFLLLNLDQLEDALSNEKIDAFSLHILKRSIDEMRFLLTTRLDKKEAKDATHEKKSRGSTQSRN